MKVFYILKRILSTKTLGIGLIFAIAAFIISNYDLPIKKLNFHQNAQVIEGKVVKVIDGDTIDLLDNNQNKHRIRLFGIDAPESKQAFGKKSREFLASMIAGKEVLAKVESKDKYGRLIATIYLNKEDINKEMVASGFAHAYTHYSDKYKADELLAKTDKRGLWIEDNPQNPYEFRRASK